MKLLVKTIQPTGKTHSGTVIFLHGSGLYEIQVSNIETDFDFRQKYQINGFYCSGQVIPAAISWNGFDF